MLENIAAQILNRYIGQYVENINTQNLSIGLLKGAVVLEDLPLRKDAFDDLGLPGVVLKSGHIGKVVLRIKSYKNIKEPWIVEIHRLRLVVGPGEPSHTVDKEQEKKKKEENKREKLQALEEKWRAKHGQNTSVYSFWYAYSSSIITTIMENLQFEVHDFHIRYEDDKTLPQKFACGVVVKNVTSKSTDETWNPTSGEHSRTDMMHKLLQLDGLSVYWDEDSEMLGDLSLDEQDNKLHKWESSDPASAMSDQRKAEFLLLPVCGEAKLTKNPSPLPLRSSSKPRIFLDVLLGEISLHLSHAQYKQAITLASELSRCEKRGIYKSGRPTESIKQNARSWWRWAYDIHLQKIKRTRQRLSAAFIHDRARKNVEYVKQYEKIIKSKMELEKMSASELAQIESQVLDMENDLTFPEIQILRDVVCERTEQALERKKAKTKEDKEQKKRRNQAGGAKGWGSWIRGWTRGWSAEEQPQETEQAVKEVLKVPEIDLHDSMYKDLNEEEIYELFGEELSEQDTNDTFLKRDSVFLKLNFKLDAGTLTLHEDAKYSNGRKLGCPPFIGIEFRGVTTTSEWRPRYKSSQVKTDLGGLYVKDLSSSRPCFCDLIRPRSPQLDGALQISQDTENMSSSINPVVDRPSNKATGRSQVTKSSVFSMLYQNRPRTSQNRFQNRLEIESAPIVITFLPSLVERVKDFFKATEFNDDSAELDDGISAAALEKYNVWKQQSQTEIKRTVKKMMDGKSTTRLSQDKWALTLKISAPEIILPEDATQPQTNIVITNLGHMSFKNHSEDDILANWNDRDEEENTSSRVTEDDNEFGDEEDEFLTPPDSPCEKAPIQPGDDGVPPKAIDEQTPVNMDLEDSPSRRRLNEKLFYERMYEQYQVHFTDLQVLVARNDEKWEATRSQGKGPHHLIERFSVNLLLERRVVQTLDSECPAVKLKGNLPRLTVHVSHDKVHSLFRCFNKLLKPFDTSSSTSRHSQADAQLNGLSKSDVLRLPLPKPTAEDFFEEKSLSKLLLCQFAMNEVSVLLEENPTSIVSILEVRRIQAEFTKRPFDHTSLFSIHSMLLIDTKQELGHDYELLLASHDNIKMDLGSGNIMDSGTTSPLLDGRSAPSSGLGSAGKILSTRNMLANVAKTLGQGNIFSFVCEEPQSPVDPTGTFVGETSSLEQEDLITVEWRVAQPGNIHSSIPTTSTAEVKFNSLDLVLNLKTWVALLDFLHHLKPTDDMELADHDENMATESAKVDEKPMSASKTTLAPDLTANDSRTSIDGVESSAEIFIQFHQLNVLLMRHIDNLDRVRGRKVGTLSLHNTKVQVTLDPRDDNTSPSAQGKDFETLVITNGSVGGLVLQDLTNAVPGDPGMEVLSLGDLPDRRPPEANLDSSFSSKTGKKSSKNQSGSTGQTAQNEAFKFTMTSGNRKLKRTKDGEDIQFEMDECEKMQCDQQEVVLNMSLASVLYMHTPRLVAEVLALADEAGDVVDAAMPTDTKQAYKDMAYSIMDKSIAMLGKSTHQLNDTSEGGGTRSRQFAGEMVSLFKLMVDMQSPIVALPKCQGSYELLVGNLGKITVRNGHALGRYQEGEDAMDFLRIAITDMNLCSRRQIEEEKRARQSPGIQRKIHMEKISSGPSLAKLKESANAGFSDIQILHDTSVRLTVRKEPIVLPRRRVLCQRLSSIDDGEVYDGPISDKKMCVVVKMTLPLAVTLSKPAYEQVLKTLDHISYGGNIDVDDIKDLDGSIYSSCLDESRFRNAPHLLQKNTAADNIASQHSTPSHNREFKLFSAPGLEIQPPSQTETTIITNRKYTPLLADIFIPQIAIQLTQDFSGGEQGVVRVTLEGFSAQLDKQNRSTTALELTLGSLDIEDLLKSENSPHRHIVSSVSYSSVEADQGKNAPAEYLSTSCPASIPNAGPGHACMSRSLPSVNNSKLNPGVRMELQNAKTGVFRPFLASGAFGVSQATHDHQSHRSRTTSGEDRRDEEHPYTPPSSPTLLKAAAEDETLVRIKAFLVDGKSTAYNDIYNETNRKIDVDFNSLDCKVNLQTWVVLLDFFGIGTSPKKNYQIDPKTEEKYNWDRRLAVSSYYENQPEDFINSEIDFKVRSFSLIFNKEEYKFMKANISKFGTHVQIRDGVLGVSGQLGSVSVSDLSPNGMKYGEKFVFAGEKAMDFDIEKFDEYDEDLQREYDIKVRLKMSAICYVHTHRFHQELVAYLQHFQQLQEVLGRMRAASVGQEVTSQSRRQARILLDIEADSPVLLIPESSHSDRLVVADLGNLTVKNSFKWDGEPGTLSQNKDIQRSKQVNPDCSTPLSLNSRSCLLDVLQANLDQMDLYTAQRSDATRPGHKSHCDDGSAVIVFSTFIVKRDEKPLLREKCKLHLQIERNLEKETTVRNVPDTSVSGQLSSVYCTVDLQQYWLIRGILDHNLGEPIPEFPQPTAFLQPSSIQTVLSGSVYTGMSIDMHLLNVSVELLEQHKTAFQNEISLARLCYVKSRLSFRSFSDQTKTVNLSCEAFVADDTRWADDCTGQRRQDTKRNVFSTVLGPTHGAKVEKKKSHRMKDSLLQFELHFREGPDFLHFTALLVKMRVYIISDWLTDVHRYLIVNPAQDWCDSLRAKATHLLEKYNQVVPGQEMQTEVAIRDEQFKVNVTNTDFVLMENPSCIDSDAVILRITAVLQYYPNLVKLMHKKQLQSDRKLLSCTLQSLEVFSCQLDIENETELSIVDPMKLNIEIDAITQKDLTQNEINFDPSLLDRNKVDIQVFDLNTRVSYNDLLLFLAITKSLSSDKKDESAGVTSGSITSMESVFRPPEKDVENLMQLSYSREDVLQALEEEDGNVQQAGEWLLENARMLSEEEMQKSKESENQEAPFNTGKIFLSVNSMCVCLIDDCADCDVPLAEFAVKSFVAEQNLSLSDPKAVGKVTTTYAGKAKFVLSGDYYNRMLSLWEPYLEPWRCCLSWNYAPGVTLSSIGRWDVKVEIPDRLDITITSTLFETMNKTKESWTRSFNRSSEQSVNLIDLGPTVDLSYSRKRKEFVPYVLRNLTGLPLKFMTYASAPEKPSTSGLRGHHAESSNWNEETWISVMPGDSHPFRFNRAEKQRHKRLDQIILHRIVTKVGHWETLSPVTISQVGVYFRHAAEEIVRSSSVYRAPDPIRVVFAVTLERSAQKVVTVRSALVVRSKVKVPVQLHLVHNVEKPVILPRLDPGGIQYIPLQLTDYGIKIRPVFSSKNLYRPSTHTIRWEQMDKDMASTSDIITCPAETYRDSDPFRFAVCVKRKSYPSYEEVAERISNDLQQPPQHYDNIPSVTKFGYVPPHMPGHTIIILPPVVVSNLLPCDLHYYFKDTSVAGKLSPGQDATLHILQLVPGSLDHRSLILGCGLEGFKECRELTITHLEKNAQMRMVMFDHQHRPLILNVRVFWRLGCSVKLSIMSGYWIVNKTGLPIVIKQEGAITSFAGQYVEHERARSLAPLLFSYSERELPYLCTMRLGKEFTQEMSLDQSSGYPHGKPGTPYCQSFSIDGGTCTRNLSMVNRDNSPSRVYYLGVGVRRGWGRYLHTHIVTLAPRFLLINMTKERALSFAQHHATSFTTDAAGLNRHLTIKAGSSIVFHWPRADLDLLLCTRLTKESNCRWSGGFVIDRIDAFHLHLRIFGGAIGNHSVFLRVEITLVDATYRVMFFDGDVSSCPSPLRIDNISAAPLVIRQCDADEGLQIDVPPSSQIPYACDEPCLPAYIDCRVQGASDSSCLNMDNIGEERVLYYENFIYIAVGQQLASTNSSHHSAMNTGDQLVLAVQEARYDQSVDGTGHMVTVERREAGKRSQLWTMTIEGFLRHEGSSPPGSTSKYPSSKPHGLVLDIAELSMSTDIMPLTIRPIDITRKSQFWSFQTDGRLCCGFRDLCVQLSPSNHVGLAPFFPRGLTLPNEHCRSEKMIAGSGVLALKVVRDGPTRVIRVMDIKQKRAGVARGTVSWGLVTRQASSHSVDLSPQKRDSAKHRRINLNVDMTKGVGFSLISNALEELIYLTMSGVRLEVSLDENTQKFSLKIQKIQIDNQLLGGHPPVMLHPTKSSRGAKSTSTDNRQPALIIEAIKLPSSNKLYEIFHSLSIDISRMCLLLEETLLLKIIQFVNSGISPETDLSLLDEAKMDLIQNTPGWNIGSNAAKRFYFDKLKLAIQPMQLSVYTASKSRLDSDLNAIRNSASLVLIQFERAPVTMQAYERQHVFEFAEFIIEEARKHFTDQLKGHAARFLGSVDFLGNPIGLLSDLKAGVGSFVRGSPGSLVKHFTHGFSNSAAKFTGSLSTLSGGITMDKEHEDKRRAIRAKTTNASDHIVAGVHSLTTGLLGGLTSVVTQTVKGATDKGAKGFFTGLGKGLVGTVTKPVTGVLDFASETASFVRDSSISSDMQVQKMRLPRSCHSFQGCLECYSASRAESQQFLHQINDFCYEEKIYSLIEIKQSGKDSMLFLVTNMRIYLMRNSEPDPEGVSICVNYSDLIGATAVVYRNEWNVELAIKLDSRQSRASPVHYSSSSSSLRSSQYAATLKKPRILCHCESTAKRICEHVNYAKMLASEQSETLPIHDDDMESDKAFDLEV